MRATMLLSLVVLFLVHSTTAAFYNLNRRWFIAGLFTTVNQTTTNSTVVNNVAYYDGSYWNTMGSGTNGQVNSIYADQCLNVYIGGNFTTAGGVNTGAVAVWTYGQSNWRSIASTPFTLTNSNDHVDSVYADCGAVISNKGCTCDVYVGGSFTFAGVTDGNAAVNFAKFTKSEWKGLGGTSSTGLVYDSTGVSSVKAIYKKLLDSNVYMGGSFPGLFKFYDGSTFSTGLVTTNPGVNSVIRSITYGINIFSTDVLYIGGTFVFQDKDGNICNGVCGYNHKTKEWSAVGGSNALSNNATVNGVAYTGSGLFATGDFQVASQSNVAYIKDSGAWASASSYGQPLSGTGNAIYACQKTDVQCTTGNFMLAGTSTSSGSVGQPFVYYYDQSSGWTPFGTGLLSSGKINSVYSKNWTAGAQVNQMSNILIICCVAIMLFFAL